MPASQDDQDGDIAEYSNEANDADDIGVQEDFQKLSGVVVHNDDAFQSTFLSLYFNYITTKNIAKTVWSTVSDEKQPRQSE